MNKSVLFLVLVLLGREISHAQTEADKRDWERGIAYEAIGEYYNAIRAYDRIKHVVIWKEKVYARIGYCNMLLHQDQQALFWYQRANEINEDNDSLQWYTSKLYIRQGSYAEAKKILQQLYRKIPSNLYKSALTSLDSAMVWQKYSSTSGLRNMREINSEYSDISAISFRDGIVFASNREGVLIEKKSMVSGQPYYDLFRSERQKNGRLGVPKRFTARLNSSDHDFAPYFTENFDTVYFTRRETGPLPAYKLYCSEFISDQWTQARTFILNDSACSYSCPSMDKEEKFFFFCSDMKGGLGGTDIYVCLKIDSLWTDPINLGPEINTQGNEEYPQFLNGVLYFSSDGHPGMGGMDVFKSLFTNGSWSHAVNIKPPVNSGADDFAFYMLPSGQAAYFTSNRQNGLGLEDIYEVSFYSK